MLLVFLIGSTCSCCFKVAKITIPSNKETTPNTNVTQLVNKAATKKARPTTIKTIPAVIAQGSACFMILDKIMVFKFHVKLK